MSKVIICITYFKNDANVSRSIEATKKSTIERIRNEIKNGIPEFKSTNFFLLGDNCNYPDNILEDNIVVEQIAQGGTINLRILPQFVDVTILSANEDPKRITIDVENPILNTITSLVSVHSDRYILAYEESPSNYRVCCSTLPLYSHNWWYNKFRLIRRIYSDDMTLMYDDDFRQFLLKNARFAAICGLSAYSIATWSELAALQLIFENNANFDAKRIKENLPMLVSPSVREDTSLIQGILTKLREYKDMSSEQAQITYIKVSCEDGCQCAYIEKIKFKKLKKFYSNIIRYHSNYYVFISPTHIKIFKDNGVTEKISYPMAMFEKMTVDEDHDPPTSLTFTFKDNAAWHIASIKASVIKQLSIVMNTIRSVNEIEVLDNVLSRSVSLEKNENDTELLELDNANNNLGDELGTIMPAAANLNNINNMNKFNDKYNDNNNINNYINSNNSSNNNNSSNSNRLVGNIINNDNILKAVSSFNLEENIDDENVGKQLIIDMIEPPMSTRRTTETKRKTVKYSEIIPPEDSSDDDDNKDIGNKDKKEKKNYDFFMENIKVLEIIEKVKVDENVEISPEEIKEINADKFFELTSDEDWKKNPLNLIILSVLLFYLFKYLIRFCMNWK